MELHLIRHPRPAVTPGTCYGRSDLPLAEPPDVLAKALRRLLPEDFALYASPLQRARLLAEALGTPHIDPRLQEIDFGEWEGRSFAEIGSAIDAWADDPLGFRAPGGESPREMATRADEAFSEIRARHDAQAVVIVAHGGPLRAIAGGLLGIAPERWLTLDFDCGALTTIRVEPWGNTLRCFNRHPPGV
ncbi:alpha-ribazole phosphatase family protein [Cognatazoarcus halotolerans]|uniref:alpha-ribazole phosphatase family protein n=1 Tax=Cognatazoarcus halotolerans TaxID=2686016 RepID=UPI00135ADF91|nr:alpha-ribazole phosphatase family protein [Cognatazoarcus halotolerans]MCB1898602.1 alpha-ribazole phosphatase family protein [Rhodocyclaceae bacterium]MCP5310678.1 alpha-ribazole phosphatase family protein [Zoogloeaceae bacterium]